MAPGRELKLNTGLGRERLPFSSAPPLAFPSLLSLNPGTEPRAERSGPAGRRRNGAGRAAWIPGRAGREGEPRAEVSPPATRRPRGLRRPLSVHPTSRRVRRPRPGPSLAAFAPFAWWPFSSSPQTPGSCPELGVGRGGGGARGPVQGARERAGSRRRGRGPSRGLASGALRAAARGGGGRVGSSGEPLFGCGKAVPPSRARPRCLRGTPGPGRTESEGACGRTSRLPGARAPAPTQPRPRARRPLVSAGSFRQVGQV